MIKITVELVSAISRDNDRLLGIGVISNVGGDQAYGTYHVELSKMQPRERQAWKTGTIQLDRELMELLETIVIDFDRERRGCWDLLYIALRQLVASRNPDPATTVPVPAGTGRIRKARR